MKSTAEFAIAALDTVPFVLAVVARFMLSDPLARDQQDVVVFQLDVDFYELKVSCAQGESIQLVTKLTIGFHPWRINVEDVRSLGFLDITSTQARHGLHVFIGASQLAAGWEEKGVLKQ
jgi:hypothetical protein